MTTVELIGGPFDGVEVDVHWGTTLMIGGCPLQDDEAARYLPDEPERYGFAGIQMTLAVAS